MTDETDYVRRTCEAATTGPWRIERDFGEGGARWDVFAETEHVARAIALLGSTWREALAVIEALGHVRTFRNDPTVLDEALRRLDTYHAAVRAHREASDGE